MLINDLRMHDASNLYWLFPTELENDLWIGFHGTSSINENAIDAEGLYWKPTHWIKDDLESVLATYDTMGWAGDDPSGYAVLKGFSVDSDYRGSDRKPIFIGETAQRCILYGSRDFAGGETARALRGAIRDLEAFHTDPVARTRWRAKRWRNTISKVDMQYPPWIRTVVPERSTDEQLHEVVGIQKAAGVPDHGLNWPWQEDLGWLADVLNELASLREHAIKLENQHQYGVVYAIQFTSDDLPHVEWRGGNGLAVHMPIPTERLLAKALIPANAKIVPGDMRRAKRSMGDAGLVAEASKRTRSS